MLHPADVSNYDQIEAIIAALKARLSRFDILISNAGILGDKSFAIVE